MATRTDLIDKSNQSKNIITYVIIGVVFLVALWLSTQSEGPSKFPKEVTDKFTFTAWVNDGEDYLKKNYRWVTKIIASYIKETYYFLEDFLLESPWILIATIIVIPCIIAGGLRLGIYSSFVVYFLGSNRNVGTILTNSGIDGSVSFIMCIFWIYTGRLVFTK